MSAQRSLIKSINPYSGTDNRNESIRLSAIDQSMKWPSLLFIVSGVLWLLLGTFLAIVTSIKMTNPGFLSQFEWFTFGRVRSAHLNTMIFGWANNSAFAVALWIMARLCRTRIRHTGLLIVAGIFWNIAVTIGVTGIMIGDMTSVEWLEMPVYATPLLAVSYALIGVWGIIAFRFRETGHVYISQWYILAALFWLPWIYSAAQIMVLFAPARGTVQALANWWFAHNLIGLWLVPIGLAAAYYLIPKVLGRPIHSYYLSILGFWTLAIFIHWASMGHLTGGPVPAWVISAGVMASIMMIIPVVVTAVNFHMTAFNHFQQVKNSPTLRFVVFGAMNFTLVSFVGTAMAIRTVSETTHFTHFTVGHAHHGVYAFFSMIMFGSLYFIMPRLLHREWPSATLINWHFWCTGLGVIIMVLGLYFAGWTQGVKLNNPEIQFIDIVRWTIPWLHLRTLSGIMITIGHVAFAINFFWMVFARAGREELEGVPTLFDTEDSPQTT